MNTEHLYKAHKKQIYGLVYKYYRLSNIPFRELLSEANYSFCLAVRSFDKKQKNAFSTYLHNKVSGRLKNYLFDIYTRNTGPIEYTDNINQYQDSKYCPERYAILGSMFDNLSYDAKKIICLALKSLNPNRKYQRKSSKKNTFTLLVAEAKVHGVKQENAYLAIKLIKNAISNL